MTNKHTPIGEVARDAKGVPVASHIGVDGRVHTGLGYKMKPEHLVAMRVANNTARAAIAKVNA